MQFDIIHTPLKGLIIIQPKVYPDERGYFYEFYNQQDFEKEYLDTSFVQDNVSFSYRGTVRGLHFQAPPYAQAKLVSVLKGHALDVVVDLRKQSETYGKYYTIPLSEDNHTMVYVPIGFAHGYSALSDTCVFYYKCTNYYNKVSEGGILWNDPKLNINWQVDQPTVSDKDLLFPTIENFNTPFV